MTPSPTCRLKVSIQPLNNEACVASVAAVIQLSPHNDLLLSLVTAPGQAEDTAAATTAQPGAASAPERGGGRGVRARGGDAAARRSRSPGIRGGGAVVTAHGRGSVSSEAAPLSGPGRGLGRGRGRGGRGGGGERLSGAQMRQKFVTSVNGGDKPRPGAGAGDTAGNSTDTESLVQQPGYNKLKMR